MIINLYNIIHSLACLEWWHLLCFLLVFSNSTYIVVWNILFLLKKNNDDYIPAHVGGLPKGSINIGGNDVGTKTRLATCKTPDMEVKDSNHSRQLLHFVLEFLPIFTRGGSLHKDT